MKKKSQMKITLSDMGREPGEPGTIGYLFDYYRKSGIPKNVTINSIRFKSNEKLPTLPQKD